MLLTLRNDHKEHLALLTTQPAQVVVDFCKLAIDYMQKGPNEKLYKSAAKKLQVESEVILNAVYGLIQLLLESCKHKLNDVDLRDSILSLGFPQEQQIVLSKFYESKKAELIEIISSSNVKLPHYINLDWRFEVQVASRSSLQQVTPIVTLNLSLGTQSDVQPSDTAEPIEEIILQTDPVNLSNLTLVLEQALNEARSQHIRRIQKTFE